MGWFWNRNGSEKWEPSSLPHPWTSGVSIYAFINSHVQPGARGLSDGAETLPDETDEGAVRFVAGGMDGVFGHHMGDSKQRDQAAAVHKFLARTLRSPSAANLKQLYETLLKGSALGYVDPLLQELLRDSRIDGDRLDQLALWLATNAPNREPVKIGVALLGLKADQNHRDVLMTLGRHDEFTLFAAVALAKMKDGEANLFALAQNVDGWGRIHIAERLSDTRDERIKAWMLREGYKNSIMNEYLAYTCATTGGLRQELQKEAVDEPLMIGAGDLIDALLRGGPAQNIDDYADGAAVVELYLRHLALSRSGLTSSSSSMQFSASLTRAKVTGRRVQSVDGRQSFATACERRA